MFGKLLLLNNKREGQSIVEFALILPILLFFILAIIQFAIILNGQITVTSAAREGARAGVVGAEDTEIVDKVLQSSRALLLRIDGDEIEIERADAVGGELKVTVTGVVDIVVPLVDIIIDVFSGYEDGFVVVSEAKMRVEKLP